jgi:hypothetical protein
MDPTNKPHQAAPASPSAPRSLSVRLVTSTPPISPAAPATPVETPPLPEDGFVGWNVEADLIIAICEYNVEGDWELQRNLVELSVGGSSQCTISIPGRGLSARHCLLDRRKHRLLLRDLDSSHGTFVRGRRLEGPADLSPGDTFTARPMTFVCLNSEMRQHRPTLFEILGPRAPLPPDWVMVQAATDTGPLLLTGEAGCDLDRLARAIHAMSLWRNQKPVEVAVVPPDRAAQVALVQQTSRTSLILPLGDDVAPLDPQFAAMLFDLSSRVRLIALASSPDVARRAFTDARAWRMQHIEVRPLAYRGGEINRLLDRRFTECAFPRRAADLTRANQDALKRYDWPGNFAELSEVADAIVAHATLGGLRPAAESLGMASHKKLARRFERVGLGFPLFDSDE